MANVIRVVVILALLGACVAIAGGAFFASENQQLRAEYKPENVKLDKDVFVQPSVLKSVFGDKTPVSVHTSPAGSDTMAAKSVAEDGTINLWVPSTFVGSAASLTPGEVQEYVIRELAKCSDAECLFDSSSTPLSAGTLTEMAADPNIKRAGDTSQMFGTFVQAEILKDALEQQARVAEAGFETARHGMDKIAQVAISGDVAQTTTVGIFKLGDGLISVAWIIGLIIVGIVVLKFLFGGGGGGG